MDVAFQVQAKLLNFEYLIDEAVVEPTSLEARASLQAKQVNLGKKEETHGTIPRRRFVGFAGRGGTAPSGAAGALPAAPPLERQPERPARHHSLSGLLEHDPTGPALCPLRRHQRHPGALLATSSWNDVPIC